MQKTVADIMSRDPITVTPDTPLNAVIQLLAERRISGLPVINQTGQLVGMVSETDLMWKETDITPPAYIMLLDSVIYLENPGQYERDLHKALGQTVNDVMSQHPITTSPDRPVKEVAKVLLDRNIRRLPVLDAAGQVVGIVTRGDVIRAMAAD